MGEVSRPDDNRKNTHLDLKRLEGGYCCYFCYDCYDCCYCRVAKALWKYSNVPTVFSSISSAGNEGVKRRRNTREFDRRAASSSC